MEKEPEELEIEDLVEEDEATVEYDIATYPSDFTLSIIHKMWHEGDIEIPDFQREFVWTMNQSSLLIESFLLGLPVPPVFFYIDKENKNFVIDGQQRILSIVYFIDGYFGEESVQGKRQVFRLSGLGDKNPFRRKRFEDLTQSNQRKLQNSVLRAINVRQLSPKENNTSIFHIFERLNTGGTPLKPQEIRNVVFRGEIVKILRTLNDDKNWRLIIGKKNRDKHQRDVELVLRIFALSGSWQTYEKPMKEYLNNAMSQNKTGDSEKLEVFQELFPKVSALIVKQLGPKQFHIRGPLNSSVLDSVFVILLDNFRKVPDNLEERYKELVADEKYAPFTYTATTDTVTVKNRFSLAKKHLIGK
jgi:hypothetical protein